MKRLAIALGVAAVLAVGGSVTSAAAAVDGVGAGLASSNNQWNEGPKGPEACTDSARQQQGATGGTVGKVCQGSGLSFIGPAVGQVATVVGPTIIGPAFVGNSVVSAGNGAGQ